MKTLHITEYRVIHKNTTWLSFMYRYHIKRAVQNTNCKMTHQLDKVDYTQQTGKLLDPKTARSDKSVAYVTNNKRLYSTFCTVKANYLYNLYNFRSEIHGTGSRSENTVKSLLEYASSCVIKSGKEAIACACFLSTYTSTSTSSYWQTRSIERPLCDSRATCHSPGGVV